MTFDLMVKFCGRQQLVPKSPSYVCLIGRRKGCYVLHWLASVKRVVVLDFSKCTFTSNIVWRQIVQTLISFEFQNIIFFFISKKKSDHVIVSLHRPKYFKRFFIYMYIRVSVSGMNRHALTNTSTIYRTSFHKCSGIVFAFSCDAP